MAKKTTNTQGEDEVQEVTEAATDDIFVQYEDLIRARVKVQDADGNLMYLDPARTQGEFILRVVPQLTSEGDAELPAEWRRPTKEEAKAASDKIDWPPPVYETETDPAAEAGEEPVVSEDEQSVG